MANERGTLFVDALNADREFSRLLRARFGKNAGDMRYQPAGKGEPGSDLRAAHDAFVAASEAWRQWLANAEKHGTPMGAA